MPSSDTDDEAIGESNDGEREREMSDERSAACGAGSATGGTAPTNDGQFTLV